MQEFPQDPPPGSPTRAQQSAGSPLAAADVAIGIGGGAVGFALSVFRLGRPLLGSVMSPLTSAARTAVPYPDRIGQAWPRPWLLQAAARGRREREALTSAVVRRFAARVPGLTNALLDQLDLSVVAERVDINGVAEQIDVDAIVRRVDLVAILDRLDPAAVTRYLVEELDLPAIIQSSTGSIMSDTVHDVRMLSISADERLSQAVDAMLLRRRSRWRAAPGTAGPSDPAETTGPPAKGTSDGTARVTA